jgi:O-antigen ligase
VWIIKHHVWMGVGTGDVKDAFQSAYTMNDSPLDKTYRLRAHNQYLTMWVTYGLFGLIAFTTIVFWPVLKDKRRDSLTIMIVLLVSLSYLTEDTLESQAGVMFMAFFYMLFTSKRAVSLAELRRPKSKEKHPSSDAPTRK